VTITIVIIVGSLNIYWNIRPCYRLWFVWLIVGFILTLKGQAFSSNLCNGSLLR